MFSNNNKISVRQLQILLILDIFGMGITLLPGRLTELALQDGWLAMALGTAAACLFALLITRVCALYPDSDIVGISRRLLGYPLGTLLSLGLVVKITVLLSLELRMFSEIIKQIMLRETPLWLISLCMLLLGSYAASKGFEARGRIGEILIFVIFIPLAFVFAVALTDVDFTNLKPVLSSGKSNILRGSACAALSLWALEYIYLSYPYLNCPAKKAGKRIILSVLASGGILSVIIALTTARFGIFDMLRQMWPVLEIMDTIDLPGSFIERQDALIMSFWIISIFLIINSGMFFSSLLFKNITGRGTHTFYIVCTAAVVYIISFLPKNLTFLYSLTYRLNTCFGWIYMLAVPIILFAAYKIRRKGGDKNEADGS